MWCDDDKIKPYFIEAGKNLTYGNLRRQLADSLEDKPFPELSEELQKHTFWEFGSIEEHFKYRNAVMQTYIYGNFPVFEGFNHMQYQIQNPEGFSRNVYHQGERQAAATLYLFRWAYLKETGLRIYCNEA